MPRQRAEPARASRPSSAASSGSTTRAAATSNSSSRAFRAVCASTGLRIVVDCAHGAAYKVAPTVFWELGAEVFSLGVSPDGLNINRECGALSPEQMRREVLARRAEAFADQVEDAVPAHGVGVVLDPHRRRFRGA